MPKYLSTNEMRSTDGRTRLKSTLNKKRKKETIQKLKKHNLMQQKIRKLSRKRK